MQHYLHRASCDLPSTAGAHPSTSHGSLLMQKRSINYIPASISSFQPTFGLQPGLDRLVLLIEVREVGDQILDHVHVRQWVDLHRLRSFVDVAQTCQGVTTINIHGATATDAYGDTVKEAENSMFIGYDQMAGRSTLLNVCYLHDMTYGRSMRGQSRS